jgi:pyruvate-formate lyase-activating enzyme
MIDLKALDVDTHRFLTGHDNARVLASLTHLDAIAKLTEVRLLLVPGVNDSPEQIEATAEWLLGLRSEPTVVLSAFRHEGTRRIAHQFREATADDLALARDRILRSWGQHRRTPPITRGLPTRHERSPSIPTTSNEPNEA